MAKILRILTYPNDVLLAKAENVKPEEYQTVELLRLVKNMTVTMLNSNGIGLAGNQVGVLKRIIVLNVENFLGAMINPKILKKNEANTPLKEGCLSFPGRILTIVRPSTIEVSWKDCDGNSFSQTFDGIAAKCIQHEIDHLDGIVFVSRLNGIVLEAKNGNN